jgi:hypothetical protein
MRAQTNEFALSLLFVEPFSCLPMKSTAVLLLCFLSLVCATWLFAFVLGANYGYGPKPIISETETLRSETFYFP